MENNNTQNPIETGIPSTAEKVASRVGKEIGSGVEKGIKHAVAGVAKETTKEGAKALGGVVVSALKPLIIKILVALGLTGAVGAATTAVVKAVKEANALKISDTPTIVEHVKKISELTTYTYIQEFVVKDEKIEAKQTSSLKTLLNKSAEPDSLHREVVIITRGVVRAGYDLAKISTEDLKISNDTIFVKLPAAEIFDVIINPSDNDIFIEVGKWSHEEITELQVNCKRDLLNNALASGILENADKTGKEKIENLFKTFGFSVVEIK